MLLAIAAEAVSSLRYASVARMMLAVTATYGLGLVLASLWNLLVGAPIRPSYPVVFGLIFLGSAVLLLLDDAAR